MIIELPSSRAAEVFILKRAFTLIELLVVIAIIAILAAILFPVFAQAKQAAKRTASISNNKQNSLAALMYMADYDDMFPIMAAWGPCASPAYVCFGTAGYLPWTQNVQPYMKNLDLFRDPQAPDFPTTPTGFNPAIYKLGGPMYGFNPYLNNNVSFPYGSGGGAPHQTRNGTSISRPADTVMLTQKYSNAEQISPYNNFYGSWWFGAGTYFITLSTDPPDCFAPGNNHYCASGWNNNTFYGGTAGVKLLNNVEAAGAWTGGGSLRGRQMLNVAWVDGHVSNKSPGAMAEGTAYNGAKAANGIPIQTEGQITITDISREHYYGLG
jgi:prepilin-type N-terminal cleavage/methylation domain-containing protein/prepilin-type processing-associated H-X9-DG protein